MTQQTTIHVWLNRDALSDSVLSSLWERMNREGLKDLVMYDGCDTFVDFVQIALASLLLVCRRGEEILGFIWVTDLIPDVRAEAHFCFFKQAWGTGAPGEAGRLAIDFLTGPEGFGVKVIHGKILDSNKTALEAVLRLGFEVVGHYYDGKNDLALVELSGRRSSKLKAES